MVVWEIATLQFPHKNRCPQILQILNVDFFVHYCVYGVVWQYCAADFLNSSNEMKLPKTLSGVSLFIGIAFPLVLFG